MNLTRRQETVFKTIVEQFTTLAEPIGSKALLGLLDFKVSSATIRNDMAALEKAGLLEKTYTSSGRVPSLLGYRYYIEHLMDYSLDSQTEKALATLFEARQFSLQEAIEVSSSLLSEMTRLTSIALGPAEDEACLVDVQMVGIDAHNIVGVLISDDGKSQSRIFSIAKSLDADEIEACTSYLKKELIGLPLREVPEALKQMQVLITTAMKAYEFLFEAFIKAFMEVMESHCIVHGRSQLLNQPEFSDPQKLSLLLDVLEDSSLFKAWLLQKGNVAIPIGKRNELIQIGDCSVVTSRFKTSQSEEGRLMVIGPNRMDYARVIPLIDYISDHIEKILVREGESHG